MKEKIEMKKLLFILCMFAMSGIFASNRVTVLGNHVQTFSKYGVKSQTFYQKNAFTDAELDKFCYAISRSKLFISAGYSTSLNSFFASAKGKATMDKFLDNGGVFYLWIPSWTWVKNAPKELYKYFAGKNIALPAGYGGAGAKKFFQCKITDEFTNSWATSPNASYPLTSAGCNNLKPAKGWKTILTADNGKPVCMIFTVPEGKGTIIVNYSAMLFDKKAAPFFENLVKFACFSGKK